MATRRILWDEGMLLGPQHLQQLDRYRDAIVDERLSILDPFQWGVRTLVIDETLIAKGEFALKRCSGIVESGPYLDAPDRDPLPIKRSFEERFRPPTDSLDVFLAVPELRAGSPGVVGRDADDAALAPWRRGEPQQVADLARPQSEQPVPTMGVNLRILFEGESLADHDTLKIARIVRTETGHPGLAHDFVPTCLLSTASDALMSGIEKIVGKLDVRSKDLSGQKRKSGGMAEAATIWLLHTLNSHLPTLLHVHKHGAHPRALFLQLATLAAQLCTFTDGRHPADLPGYEHGKLTESFTELIGQLEQLLDTVIPFKCIPLAMERESETRSAVRLSDASLLKGAELYLSVRADIADETIVAELPQKAKISSPDGVRELVMRAVPGLSLINVPVKELPPEIPVQPGRLYFVLVRHGDHWDAICKSLTMAFHIPPDFPGLEMELMALKD